jgi:hypothetical protein
MKDISYDHGRSVSGSSFPSGGSVVPNDAKLGLVIGLGLVIAVAVIYFRNDSSRKPEESPAATAVKPASATRHLPPPRGQARATKARPTVHADPAQQGGHELQTTGNADAPERQP